MPIRLNSDLSALYALSTSSLSTQNSEKIYPSINGNVDSSSFELINSIKDSNISNLDSSNSKKIIGSNQIKIENELEEEFSLSRITSFAETVVTYYMNLSH